MANLTAEAPVRPKNTRKPAKSAEAVTSAPVLRSEAEELQAQALHILMCISSDLSEAGLFDIPGAENAAITAVNIAYDLCHPDECERPRQPLDGIVLIRHHLESVGTCLGAAPSELVPTAISAAGLQEHADQFAQRLFAAIGGLPATLEDLRVLTTYAGAKPYRNRPTPPIRREPAATLEPGLLSRGQLQRFMEELAGGLSTINQTLQMAQTCDEDWQRQRLLDAGQLMVQSLGAIADHASGSSVGGSIGDWMCGPFFDELGDAA